MNEEMKQPATCDSLGFFAAQKEGWKLIIDGKQNGGGFP